MNHEVSECLRGAGVQRAGAEGDAALEASPTTHMNFSTTSSQIRGGSIPDRIVADPDRHP